MKGPRPMQRFPLGPALAQAVLALDGYAMFATKPAKQSDWFATYEGVDLLDAPNLMTVADYLGIAPRVLHRAKRDGLTERQADQLALRLGLHPALLWPEWLTEDAA